MAARRRIFGPVLALVCAYLVVLQSALGGFASAGHAAAAIESPFGVICLNGPDGDASDVGQDEAERRGCCTLGCAPLAVTPPTAPEPRAFAYGPRPTPRRAAGDREPAPQSDVLQALKRPRGPPATV